jgi:hypothetical protein
MPQSAICQEARQERTLARYLSRGRIQPASHELMSRITSFRKLRSCA